LITQGDANRAARKVAKAERAAEEAEEIRHKAAVEVETANWEAS